MKPKSTGQSQGNLFTSRLDQILNMAHPLIVLAGQVDWQKLDDHFGAFYKQDFGRPGLPTRLMVGLHYLKYAFNESDESLADRFLENPYWQYFCGFDYFQHKIPFDPSSMSRWRQRIGEEGAEELLKQTIETAVKTGQIKKSSFQRLNVDTTVQEKNIAFPTDARLYDKARVKLVKAARQRNIELRQSYARVGKRALRMQSRYRHARQPKRARRELKKLKNYLGRVLREIRREPAKIDAELEALLQLTERLYEQKRGDKNKLYSLHEPEVECIAKGKAHKKYEFGCKASFVTTSRDNWIVGAKAFHGNPYDGHTLREALSQSERLTSWKAKQVYCDKGYRGQQLRELKEEGVEVAVTAKKRMSWWDLKWLKRRSAIEPVIGHLKSDNRLNRNYLKGSSGDKLNAVLAACGFNLRKLLGAIRKAPLFSFMLWLQQTILWSLRAIARPFEDPRELSFN